MCFAAVGIEDDSVPSICGSSEEISPLVTRKVRSSPHTNARPCSTAIKSTDHTTSTVVSSRNELMLDGASADAREKGAEVGAFRRARAELL